MLRKSAETVPVVQLRDDSKYDWSYAAVLMCICYFCVCVLSYFEYSLETDAALFQTYMS